MGRAIAGRLNADRSDEKGPRQPCACGAWARYAGRRAKTFTTALSEMERLGAWYHCENCGAGFSPRDRALGLEGTSLSPAALRMAGLAAARVSFAETGELLRELAGLDIDAKLAERQAEALGREIAADERQIVEPEPATARTLYLGFDGTGVPVRKAETRGRRGKQPDGSAKTREAKIVAVWSADTLDRDGRPARDPGSVTYSGAIETIASRDTDTEPSPFAGRALREAERRCFDEAPRRAILGDGALWIWNWADEHAPGAIQIVDIFHAKGHLFDVAKAIYGAGTDLADQWGKQRRDELDQGRIDDILAASAAMPKPATTPASASTTSTTTATGCGIPNSGPWAFASRPALSRAAARTSSQAASSAAECTGPSLARTPSWPCDAPSSATGSTTSGNVAQAQNSRHLTNLTCTRRWSPRA